MAKHNTSFHCTDCIYSSFDFDEELQEWQGTCSRRYTLANPHLHKAPQMYFADRPEQLVPIVDPYGKEYMRTKNTCDNFARNPGSIKQR